MCSRFQVRCKKSFAITMVTFFCFNQSLVLTIFKIFTQCCFPCWHFSEINRITESLKVRHYVGFWCLEQIIRLLNLRLKCSIISNQIFIVSFLKAEFHQYIFSMKKFLTFGWKMTLNLINLFSITDKNKHSQFRFLIVRDWFKNSLEVEKNKN